MTNSSITVGEIRESQAVAIGEGAQATLNQYTEIIVKLDNIENLPPAPGQPPYKGLAYFTEQDRDIFFGREKLSDKLANRITTSHFLAVIGASGSGKSSLLRAGVIPRLRERNWHILILKPGVHPLAALANTLTQDDPTLTAAGKLQQALAHNSDTLYFATSKLAARHQADRLLLVVDQFEEVLTQCKDAEERRAFVNNLLCTAEAQGAATVLISMRADFYDRITEFRELSGRISQQQELILPMADENLVRVIAEPAKRGGWQFVEGLVEQMIEDVGREPGRLPLLSHALLETWQRRRGVTMTLGGYRDAGGVEGAIAKTAEETLALFTLEQAAITRELFLNLTELGEGAEDTRRIANRADLAARMDEADLNHVLETMVQARLITLDEHNVEVAHEALIRRWPTLRGWLADDRERLRFERQLSLDAAEWERLDCDPDALYRGVRLARAVELVESRSLRLAPQPSRFLVAGRELLEQEEKREEERHQRELERQRTLAAAQRQRADAEARSARWLRGVLAVSVLLIGVLTAITAILIVPLVQEWQAKREARTELIMIPAGTAIIGTNEPDAEADEQPKWSVELPSFYMEKYEVANWQYRLCVKFRKCAIPNDPTQLYDDNLSNHPVGSLTAVQAAAYCQWIDRRLPTEVEWEYAARSDKGRSWPWGDTAPTGDAGCQYIGETTFLVAENGSESTPEGEGVYNLCGNVWEWTSSVYSEDGYLGYDLSNVWDGMTLPTPTTPLVQRGGSVEDAIPRITYRLGALPYRAGSDMGVRCVEVK